MKKVGIIKDDTYLEHITDDFHPENPERLASIYRMLKGIEQTGLVYVPARPATDEEIALNHDQSYIAAVRETKGKIQRRLDPDTVTSAKSYEAACMAAGGLCELIDACMSGQINNGFALVRPPGHHAEPGRSMGFCIFNNIAVGARYLKKKYGSKRILIVDFDLHHGNGTQHSFYEDASVLYVSTHQYPYYPGTGWYTEVGQKEGKGYTVNIPFNYGMNDADYIYAFRQIVVPVGHLFKPEIVLVSAGFDIHLNDPLGGMGVTEHGFARMAGMLIELAQAECGGKVLFVLEGGYDIRALTDSVKTVIMELKGTPVHIPENDDEPCAGAVQLASKVKQALEPYWGAF
jgi:acetoin utilization deacetylase AcuC-like enzyme